MNKYFAFAGIRHYQGTTSNLATWPFLVIMGPSGQLVQVHGPSGNAGSSSAIPRYPHYLQAYEQTFNHKALAFNKNEIVLSLRYGRESAGRNLLYAWSPMPQTEGRKQNSASFPVVESNVSLTGHIMKDGYNWSILQGDLDDFYREHHAAIKLSDSIFWTFPLQQQRLCYGTYKQSPQIYVDIANSGWKPNAGKYGPGNNTGDVHYNLMSDAGLTNPRWEGITPASLNDYSDNICDMIEHNGTIYIAKQYAVYALTPGDRGNTIHFDYAEDSGIAGLSETSSYTTRRIQGEYGPLSRCFAVHNNILYMLQNDGKLFEIYPGGIKEKADLSILGTPWSSGITGGYCPALDTPWVASNGKRCYLASYNNQLHAFLNFSSTYKLAKGAVGYGIFWGTSHDAENWSDRSENLPSSGVITPSGLSSSDWRTTIAPYLFSGKNATVWPLGYGHAESGVECQPSGYRQIGIIPWWSSGVLLDVQYTPYGSLQVPLQYGTISGFLFPTNVAYPFGYGYQDEVWAPSGVGASGYDYSGCKNYHIAGHVDKDNRLLRLMFSEDYNKGTLFYSLNRSSGWIQQNYVPESKQLNSYIPIDLYSPEIIIPSGTLYNPNPRIDEVNKRVYVNYNILDWGFWDLANISMEYSIDGSVWSRANAISIAGLSDSIRNRSTGSKASDPSGVIGASYTACWDYSKDLSSNVFYPNTKIRIRAESI